MLEFIRTHRRLMQGLLLLVILPSFAFVGLESYTRMGDAGNTLAKVAGQTITQQEFDAAHRQQMDRLRQMFGGQFDTAMFDTPQARQEILDGLIAQRALLAEAVGRKLTVTDATLQQTILAIPDLTNAEGQFDVDRYRSLLAMQGMSPQMFEARLRQDLVLQNMNGAIQGSAFVPRTVAEYVARISEQEREFQEQLFAAADYLPKVRLTDEMMQSYYQDSGSRFEIAEQVKAEYLVLSLEALAEDI